MPTLNEGTLLYMPTTLPGMSVTKAAELLQTQDRIIQIFPEVESVYGKAGRASTATDPAPTEMFETVINLKPKEEWRPGVTVDSLIAEMDKALQFPGVSNAWTMPIKARIDMLSTGIRTPVGVKVFGTDLAEIERLAKQIEPGPESRAGHHQSPTPSAGSAATTSTSTPDRAALARYGIMIQRRAGRHRHRARRRDGDHDGGRAASATASTCAIRASCADNPQAIASDVLVPMPAGGAVPLGEVAKVEPARGPTVDPHRERTVAQPTSTSTSATATSAAMSPTRSRRCRPASSSRPATT